MISRMSEMNRRDFGIAMAAFAALASVAEAQSKDTVAMNLSTVFRYDKLPVVHNANGGESRAVMHGTLPTGEFVEVHETMLPAGKEPHPPHRHSHSEFLLIQEGTLEYSDEGNLMPAGPRDVVFSASMRMHGLKNVGTTPARYFVVAVGVQKAEA
jgi:mannose-6-phosphate isomerase-like protein (cupin superfamily)